jgi:hypothetical protein
MSFSPSTPIKNCEQVTPDAPNALRRKASGFDSPLRGKGRSLIFDVPDTSDASIMPDAPRASRRKVYSILITPMNLDLMFGETDINSV